MHEQLFCLKMVHFETLKSTFSAQEMAMYEQYIVGMLVNFSTGLPADRIHNMLKMFVPDQAYDKSAEQLQNFLGQLVGDEKLQVMGGIYTKRT